MLFLDRDIAIGEPEAESLASPPSSLGYPSKQEYAIST